MFVPVSRIPTAKVPLVTAVTVKVNPVIDPVTTAPPVVGAAIVTTGAEVYALPPSVTITSITVFHRSTAVIVLVVLVTPAWAPVPPPPVNTTVGSDVYPDPTVTTKDAKVPFVRVTVAVPFLPLPFVGRI